MYWHHGSWLGVLGIVSNQAAAPSGKAIGHFTCGRAPSAATGRLVGPARPFIHQHE